MKASFIDSINWLVDGMSLKKDEKTKPDYPWSIYKAGFLILKLIHDDSVFHEKKEKKTNIKHGIDMFIYLNNHTDLLKKYANELDKSLPEYNDLLTIALLRTFNHSESKRRIEELKKDATARNFAADQIWIMAKEDSVEIKNADHSVLKRMTRHQMKIICACGYLYDAFLSEKEKNCHDALEYFSMAMMLALKSPDSLMIDKKMLEIQIRGGKNRHKATEPFKEWIYETVSSRHRQTPFKSRAEAVRNIEDDVIEEAKRQNMKLPENLRDFIERALIKHQFSI